MTQDFFIEIFFFKFLIKFCVVEILTYRFLADCVTDSNIMIKALNKIPQKILNFHRTIWLRDADGVVEKLQSINAGILHQWYKENGSMGMREAGEHLLKFRNCDFRKTVDSRNLVTHIF